ncbi:unnamed protein product, partial [marine sediment metagenome]
EALLDDEGLEALRGWDFGEPSGRASGRGLSRAAGGEPEIVERYTGAATEGWAFGAPYRATVRARLELTLSQGKQAVYRDSVRAGMQDFIAAIRDPQHTLEVTVDDGRNSLAVALAATRAAETGTWETISYGEA